MVNIVATRGCPKATRIYGPAVTGLWFGHVTIRRIRRGDDKCHDIVVADTIRIPPEAVDPIIKNYGRLDFVRILFEAYDKEARYAVLLDGEGNVTEGRGWNIFALNSGHLISPDEGVLQGITRRTVVELAEKLNIKAKLRSSVNRMRGAEEIFLTSTAGGIVPVKSIDGKSVGDGNVDRDAMAH